MYTGPAICKYTDMYIVYNTYIYIYDYMHLCRCISNQKKGQRNNELFRQHFWYVKAMVLVFLPSSEFIAEFLNMILMDLVHKPWFPETSPLDPLDKPTTEHLSIIMSAGMHLSTKDVATG